MRKFIKCFLVSIICLPILIIVLFIGYEVLGAAVNHISTGQQTKKIVQSLEKADAEILDTYSFTGNTSGTGNRVEMLSVVAVKTTEIEKATPELEKYECGVIPYEQVSGWEYEYYLEQLDLPENIEDCYLIVKCESAPFVDNIEGH